VEKLLLAWVRGGLIVSEHREAYNTVMHSNLESENMSAPCNTREICSTPIFSLEHREYAVDGGTIVARDVVVHPGAVVILPVLADGSIVMIRNYRWSIGQQLWELPAGTREPNESAVQTARRELEEETGYRAGHLQPLVTFFASPGIMTEEMSVFVATDLKRCEQSLQGDERIIVEVVQAWALRDSLLAGDLRDGKTIATLGMYFLKQQLP